MTAARPAQGPAGGPDRGLVVKRRGPGEVAVLDADGCEVATIYKDLAQRRWRVAVAPSRARTLHRSDPEFDTRRAALTWLSEVQFR